MDKFGVEEADQDNEKRANYKRPTHCPICNRLLLPEESTGVLLCEEHGSLPFEEK